MATASDGLLVLRGDEVTELLEGKEHDIVNIVRRTYEAHAKGRTAVPFSTFLRFPEQPRDRIISLPAFVDDGTPVAGIKWVSSFPGNIDHGLERASAIIALNDMQTGRPYTILEASRVNAARTAASATLAAKLLLQRSTDELTLVGCGPINQTIAHYIVHVLPRITKVRLYDVSVERAASLAASLEQELSVETAILSDITAALSGQALVSIATNAATPSINTRGLFASDSLVLHISLRDISPEIIRDCTNVVDDIEHVNRENTSIHLASQQAGNTDFIDATIGEVSLGEAHGLAAGRPIVYSPFGLGALDIAVGHYLYGQAAEHGSGTLVAGFFPQNGPRQ